MGKVGKTLMFLAVFFVFFVSPVFAQTWKCRLSWVAASDPQGDLAGYKIYRSVNDTTPVIGQTLAVAIISQGGSLAPVDNFFFDLGPGFHYFWLSAFDALGNETLLNGAASVNLGSGEGFAPVWPEGAELKIEVVVPEPVTSGGAGVK